MTRGAGHRITHSNADRNIDAEPCQAAYCATILKCIAFPATLECRQGNCFNVRTLHVLSQRSEKR